MTDHILRILKKTGPMISSDLAKQVAAIEGISENTASQRIVRHKEVIKIKGFFKSNMSLVYLQRHADEDMVYHKLSDLMYAHGRKYWYTLNAMHLHNGSISQQFLECYTNYPIEKLRGHLPFKTIMQKFVNQNILVFNGDRYLLSPKLQSTIANHHTSHAIETIKTYVLDTFHSIIRNTGLISFDTGEFFAEHGKFRWAFKGVSTILGLKDSANRAGFLLADILLGVPIREKDVQFFTAKIDHIQSFKGASRIIPFLIVDDLDRPALLHLKNKGIAIGFMSELFGAKYADTLKELVTILSNAAASLKSDPEKYLSLIKEMKKYNEGLLGNIRGTLFEYAVGHIHVVDCQNIEIGREILDKSGSKHEMDVIAVYSDRIVIAECKGRKSMVHEDEIEDWLQYAIPAARKWVERQENYNKKKIEFEFWSTGGFTPNAEELLKDAAEEYSKVKISYFGPIEIRKKAIDMDNKKLKEALDNYFLKTNV